MAQVNITFLDVGQGDGTVITCPNGELVLIDLGSKKNAQIAGADAVFTLTAIIVASMMFRGLETPTLDRLLLTHGDGDHTNLLSEFLTYIQVFLGKPLDIKEVAIGGVLRDYDHDVNTKILDPAFDDGRLVSFDDDAYDEVETDGTVTPHWRLGGGTNMYLLSANYPTDEDEPNSKSLVVMVEYGGRKVILTGDAECATEASIINHYATKPGFLRSFGLKLGHHGSRYATSVPWIQAVGQQASFASSDMRWAHPYCETINRIANTIGLGRPLYQHQWLCGDGPAGNQTYTNHTNQAGFYTTMASISEFVEWDRDTRQWIAPGMVRGVQYQLSMYDNGSMQLIDTMGHDSGRFVPGLAAGEPLPAASPPDGTFVPPLGKAIPVPPVPASPGG
jgi:beta-lactamase superfamily II metal-dependent hydrolase